MADVLIIDDDKLICDVLMLMMEKIGHQSRFALTGQDGLKLIGNHMFDIVFLDVNLPDTNGFELIKVIKTADSFPEIIIITGESNPDGAEIAIRSGAWNYIEKPFLRQEINLQVSRALQFRKEKGHVSSLGGLKTNGIIGESEEIKSCIDQVSIAAYSDANVLISGEPGTGKELFAKTIHLNSDRGDSNFVIVDCVALNNNTADAMLFGCKKGDISGTLNNKIGLIKLAHNGTLFLDEICELPIQTQKSFLYAMENLMFTPRRDGKEKSSNFRVIATSTKNLDELAEQGRFRKDLLLKLNDTIINLPPLKDIKEDIIKLTLFYIDHYCKKYKVETKGVSPEFLDIVSSYGWPGNVRELINAIDKAIASSKNEPTLYSIHLPSYVKAKAIKRALDWTVNTKEMVVNDYSRGQFPSLKFLMENTEKNYLNALFVHTNGDVKKACDISGMSKSRMYTRIKNRLSTVILGRRIFFFPIEKNLIQDSIKLVDVFDFNGLICHLKGDLLMPHK
jgi:two-component system NtrC family response regulator